MNCDNLVLLVTAAFSILVIDLALAKDYYKILGIPRDANDKQIKKAFRKLAVKYHPDKNKAKEAEVKFREIAEGRYCVQNFVKNIESSLLKMCFLLPRGKTKILSKICDSIVCTISSYCIFSSP